MRRLPPLLRVGPIVLAGLSGCTGYGEFLDHAFSLPGSNPNIPMADSENLRRALGQIPDVKPLETEPGNVWPKFDTRDPTLQSIANNPTREDERGFPATVTPGKTPGLPDSREPRPVGRTRLPRGVNPGQPDLSLPPPPTAGVPRAPGTLGSPVQTPQGTAIDTGGNNNYRQLNTPRGPGAIVVPNGNGTSTVINPDGTVQSIPTPR